MTSTGPVRLDAVRGGALGTSERSDGQARGQGNSSASTLARTVAATTWRSGRPARPRGLGDGERSLLESPIRRGGTPGPRALRADPLGPCFCRPGSRVQGTALEGSDPAGWLPGPELPCGTRVSSGASAAEGSSPPAQVPSLCLPTPPRGELGQDSARPVTGGELWVPRSHLHLGLWVRESNTTPPECPQLPGPTGDPPPHLLPCDPVTPWKSLVQETLEMWLQAGS